MPQEVNPLTTQRAEAYRLWMNAPNPMVTFFKTLDVTRLVKISGSLSSICFWTSVSEKRRRAWRSFTCCPWAAS